jgi:hypothetical protein
LGFSNWPVIYYKPTSFLAPSNAIKFSNFIITVPPSVSQESIDTRISTWNKPATYEIASRA